MISFSLNLVELYNNMADEYGRPVSEYMSYDDFVERFIEAIEDGDVGVGRCATGEFLVIHIPVEEG